MSPRRRRTSTTQSWDVLVDHRVTALFFFQLHKLWRAKVSTRIVWRCKGLLRNISTSGLELLTLMNEHGLNNGAAVSFKSATATAAGPNLCGRGERQLGTLAGRVNLWTKTNKRHNRRNKARCLANLTDWIIFLNVPLLLSGLRHAVARPRSTILTARTRLALKCSEPLYPCPRGRASHSDCGSSNKASQRQPMWSLQGCCRIVLCLSFPFAWL